MSILHLVSELLVWCAGCSDASSSAVPPAVGVGAGAAGAAAAAAAGVPSAAGAASAAAAGAGAPPPGMDPDKLYKYWNLPQGGTLPDGTHVAPGAHLGGGIYDGSKGTVVGGHVDVGDWGFHADGTVNGQLNLQTGSGGATVGAFDASAEGVWNREGYYGLGAGANLVDGSVNYGDPGGDKTARGDWFVRGGASAGVGAAGRGYFGTDVDGDGYPEYGVGADFEWVSFDVRVEGSTPAEPVPGSWHPAPGQSPAGPPLPPQPTPPGPPPQLDHPVPPPQDGPRLWP